MDLMELKESILNKTFNLSFLVLEYLDNTFLANQYAHEIIKLYSDYEVVYVESLEDVQINSFSIFEDKTIYLVKTNNLDALKINLEDLDKVIVICNKHHSMYDKYVVNIDKLKEWQIEDYLQVMIPGLHINKIKWLCEISKYDIYRLYNEACKINIFDRDLQEEIFRQINEDDGYSDLCQLDIFSLTNAVLRRDRKAVLDVLDNINNIDIEPVGLVTLLYKNFRLLSQIQSNSKITYSQLGISSSQFNAIKSNNLGRYSNTELINIIKMLSDIDYKLKSGQLPSDKIIDYVLDRIL